MAKKKILKETGILICLLTITFIFVYNKKIELVNNQNIYDESIVNSQESESTLSQEDNNVQEEITVSIGEGQGNIVNPSIIYITSYNDFISNLDNDKFNILVLARTGCGHCQSYYPKLLEATSKYNINIYYIDYAVIEKSELDKISEYTITVPGKCSYNNEEKTLSSNQYTPNTLFIKEKKTIDCITGNISSDTLNTNIENYLN